MHLHNSLKRVVRPVISTLLIAIILFGNASFVFAALPPNAKVSYYLYDHLGGVDKMLDDKGNVVCSNDYLPYGDLRRGDCTENNESYGFTGKEKDPETDLYYYGGRYYDPKIGRFITQDPMLMDLEGIKPEQKNAFLGDPQNLSPYSYALNNPLKYVDPTGESATLAAILSLVIATAYTYIASTQNVSAPDVGDPPGLSQSETEAIGNTITAAFESAAVTRAATGMVKTVASVGRTIKSARDLSKSTTERLSPNNLIPTEKYDPVHLQKVQKQMQAKGSFSKDHPIKYFEDAGKKYIVDGHHRVQASRNLGYEVFGKKVDASYFKERWGATVKDFMEKAKDFIANPSK